MYYDKDTMIFLDGKMVKAAETSTDLYGQSLHYGAGVFEGIRSYKTDNGASIFKSKEHYERLHYSAKTMSINLGYSVEELDQLSYEVLKANNLEDAYLRPLVYLGADMQLKTSSEVHVMICAWSWGKYLGDTLLDLMTSSFQRPNPKSCFVDAKVTGHYTNSILATTEAKGKGFNEALLLDANGNVAEGPGANFFMEKDGQLYTPPKGNIMPGITRQTLIELCNELSISVSEKHFNKEEVYEADSAFYCGTAAEVAGINSLDGNVFPLAWEDSLGKKLSIAYSNMVRSKNYKTN